jgi:hypothetical protein
VQSVREDRIKLLGVAPFLTRAAAAYLAALMSGAVATHMNRREPAALATAPARIDDRRGNVPMIVGASRGVALRGPLRATRSRFGQARLRMSRAVGSFELRNQVRELRQRSPALVAARVR